MLLRSVLAFCKSSLASRENSIRGGAGRPSQSATGKQVEEEEMSNQSFAGMWIQHYPLARIFIAGEYGIAHVFGITFWPNCIGRKTGILAVRGGCLRVEYVVRRKTATDLINGFVDLAKFEDGRN